MRALDKNGIQLSSGMRVLGPDGRNGKVIGLVDREGVIVKWDGDADDEVVDPESLITTNRMTSGRRRRSG